jgi:hypothetical protein
MRILILLPLLMCSCTLSFQNISTHGSATDLVDENQSPTVTTDVSIPKPM